MKQIIDLVGFPQDRLMGAASRPALFCSLEKMDHLLSKMHGAKNVRCVIQNGIKRLFSDDHTYRIPEVFVFLEGRVLLNVDLHGTVVQTVFLEGAKRHYERWIDYCQAHPAINFLTYGNALVYTGRKNSQHPLFKGLIARSDKDDLVILNWSWLFVVRVITSSISMSIIGSAWSKTKACGREVLVPEEAKRTKINKLDRLDHINR